MSSLQREPKTLADGLYTGAAASSASALLSASALVLLVNGELVRDLRPLELDDVPPGGCAAVGSPLSLHSRLTASHLSPPLPFVVRPNAFEPQFCLEGSDFASLPSQCQPSSSPSVSSHDTARV